MIKSIHTSIRKHQVMAISWEGGEMADEVMIWEDEHTDIWMIEDDSIIWEDEHTDAWMLQVDIWDMIRSIIVDIILL